MNRRNRPAPRSLRSQAGAVLYVALIMLILLALLGIAGMRVSGMQERMAYNYRSANLAFQNAEARVRDTECFVESVVNRTGTACAAVTIGTVCNDGFDASFWAQSQALNTPIADRVNVRAIGQCISGNTSLAMGVKSNDEDPNPIYQVTVYATDPDSPTGGGADAAVDTIFRP